MNKINFKHFETIDSTNLWCNQNLQDFENNTTYVVTADVQTNGKGTKDRSWYSPKGGLYSTICIPLNELKDNSNTIPLVTAIAICDTFKEFGIDVKIKWPNDLILNDKKIGGILSECTTHNGITWVMIGIGINTNTKKNDISHINRPLFTASSVYVETQKIVDNTIFIEKFIPNFTSSFGTWLSYGFDKFIHKYNENSILTNKIVHIENQNQLVIGTVDKIGNSGELHLTTVNGPKMFINGDIIKIIN
jgi:BirA family biotin operon repressor/biotin-[acetyl-CoA-carboxylase] ligase